MDAGVRDEATLLEGRHQEIFDQMQHRRFGIDLNHLRSREWQPTGPWEPDGG